MQSGVGRLKWKRREALAARLGGGSPSRFFFRATCAAPKIRCKSAVVGPLRLLTHPGSPPLYRAARSSDRATRSRQQEVLIEFLREGKIDEALRAFKKIYLEVVHRIIVHLEVEESASALH